MNQNIISRFPWQTVLFVSIIGLALRLIAMIFVPDQGFPDSVSYMLVGKELLETGRTLNPLALPLYPLWVVIWGKTLLPYVDSLISSASTVVFAMLAHRLFFDKLVTLLTAIISSIYPHFILYSLFGLTEILFTFIIFLGILFLYKEKFLLGFVTLAASVLIRPTFELFIPILVFLIARCYFKLPFSKSFIKVGKYLLVYVIIMSPWWIHNYKIYDTFVRTNLGTGLILYTGNNPMNRSGGGITGTDVDANALKEWHSMDTVKRDFVFKEKAILYILKEPDAFFERAWLKTVRTYRLYPFAPGYQDWKVKFIFILSFGPILLGALGFLLIAKKGFLLESLPLVFTVLYLTFVHAVTIGSMRYRLPIEPILIIFAAFFYTSLLRRKLDILHLFNLCKTKIYDLIASKRIKT
jgi:hypothetical protein